jgi:alpha-tubulin suppressor-like RCC1 family protein
VRVASDMRFAAISTGGEHTCARAEDGRAHCWGRNENASQLGDRTTVSHRGLPAPVADGRVFASIQAGEITTCGVTPGGESFCWGSNYFGALGNGTTSAGGVNHPVPTRGGPYHRVSPGGSHTCGLAADGRVFCWGDGFYGQVGGG